MYIDMEVLYNQSENLNQTYIIIADIVQSIWVSRQYPMLTHMTQWDGRVNNLPVPVGLMYKMYKGNVSALN